MDDAETTLSGSAFQIFAAVTTGKARLPIVDSVKDGTTRAGISESVELTHWQVG